MVRILFLGLLALFFLEIAGFIIVGDLIGVLSVLVLVIIGMVFGVNLIKKSGFAIASLGRGTPIDPELMSQAASKSLFGAVAGILFIFPGFISDLFGLGLLFPPLSRWAARKLAPHIKRSTPPHNPYGPVIDGEVTVIENETPPQNTPQ